MSKGIDYGMGTTNINLETGIRYGVISHHDVLQAWSDSSEGDYGSPCCPTCGNDAVTIPSHSEQLDNGVAIYQDTPDTYADYEQAKYESADYACESCRTLFGSESAFPEDAHGYTVDDGEYKASSYGDSGFGIFVTLSPYYTYAGFCSPCAPGAGDLNHAISTTKEDPLAFDGVKTYCFGHDWFEEGKAPYRVFRVADGVEVLPDAS